MLLFVFFPLLALAQTELVQLEHQVTALPPTSIDDLRPWLLFIPTMKKGREFKKIDGRLVYDFSFTHSPQGFRTYPDIKPREKYKAHLVLGGCSFTYSQGLNDPETFGYRLAQNFPESRVVNVSRRGGYGADHLYIFKFSDLSKLLPEKKGTFVFTMLENHFERMDLTWRYLSWSLPNTPYFEETNSQWEYKGVLQDTWKYRYMKLVKYLGLELYWLRLVHHFSASDPRESNRRMASLLRATKEAYLRQFPEGRFVASWMMGSQVRFTSELENDFLRQLREHGIEVWHPPKDSYQGDVRKYLIPNDGHPNRLANQEYFEFLSSRLLGNH
jgi:hypothetical protein